ncbi:MAG: 4'-phosphopantetheinyl transferase superfamily protein [Eubacterium sp.]|nr:4'-phosphopantetheinyl transferase superfamily protein [Eubacterium sp.]
MDNQVFAIDVSELSDKTVFDSYYVKQRKDRRERVDRMKFDSGKRLCLGGGIVMEKALETAGCSAEEIQVTKEGKPYVNGCFFNISHAGEIAVSAVSDKQVGVDVEKPREFGESLIKKAFTQAEINYVEARNSDLSQSLYTKLWTVKESVMKWLGTGISLMPEFIEVDLTDKISVKIIDDPDKNKQVENLKFTTFEHNDYHITVCSEYDNFCKKIEWI